MIDRIEEGFMVFVSDGEKGIGAVREVLPGDRPELVIYVENAGDFVIPLTAIHSVHFGKVILDCDRLDERLRKALGRVHDAEDPVLDDPVLDE